MSLNHTAINTHPIPVLTSIKLIPADTKLLPFVKSHPLMGLSYVPTQAELYTCQTILQLQHYIAAATDYICTIVPVYTS